MYDFLKEITFFVFYIYGCVQAPASYCIEFLNNCRFFDFPSGLKRRPPNFTLKNGGAGFFRKIWTAIYVVAPFPYNAFFKFIRDFRDLSRSILRFFNFPLFFRTFWPLFCHFYTWNLTWPPNFFKKGGSISLRNAVQTDFFSRFFQAQIAIFAVIPLKFL